MKLELNEEKLRSILDEYLAPVQNRQRMKPQEIERIAYRLNEKINIPFVSEEKEGDILVKIVLKVDNFLYDNLPNEIYDLIRSTENGIDEEESKRLIKSFSELANRKIDIPYAPEGMEGFAIKLILTWVFKAMCKNSNIEKAEGEIDANKILSEQNQK
ncbi:MAG: hypothetical protein MI922_08570 [Bacteroidales bacterium]|nr:hypothetical protein [Bacteroidales bacterium]